MELVDSAIMLVIPGAMDAGLAAPLLWTSLALSLLLTGAAAFPANRWLIARGRGHAVVHAHDHGPPRPAPDLRPITAWLVRGGRCGSGPARAGFPVLQKFTLS